MDRINSSNMATLSPGSRRGWQNQNLPSGIAGTVFDATYENGSQEELLALIEGVGITPNATGWAQVLQGLKRLLGGNYTHVTATATLTADNAGRVTVDASAGDVTLTLPAAAATQGSIGGVSPVLNSVPFRIIRVDATFANTVTIQAASGDTLTTAAPAATTLPLVPGGEWEIFSDGVNTWYAVYAAAQPRGTAYSSTAGTFNWSCPPGVFWVEAEMWDAGAGGAYASTAWAGGGGGGGGYFRGVIPVKPGNVYGHTVGTGSAAGNSTTPNGANVTATSALIFENGGVTVGTGARGGLAGSAAGSPGGVAPTVSGLAAGSYMILPGNPGAPGESAAPYAGGLGGASYGGSAVMLLTVGVGDSGTMPGVGGGGGTPAGTTAEAGSAGQNGAIFLKW